LDLGSRDSGHKKLLSGTPMALGNMRAGTRFRAAQVCAKCGSRRNKIDVRPNWKEQPTRPTVLRHDERR
jgi:hypothetical protein